MTTTKEIIMMLGRLYTRKTGPVKLSKIADAIYIPLDFKPQFSGMRRYEMHRARVGQALQRLSKCNRARFVGGKGSGWTT
jgi:hypothetical protein